MYCFYNTTTVKNGFSNDIVISLPGATFCYLSFEKNDAAGTFSTAGIRIALYICLYVRVEDHTAFVPACSRRLSSLRSLLCLRTTLHNSRYHHYENSTRSPLSG